MKIGIDIGGTLSKYPDFFRWLISSLNKENIFILTDMSDKNKVLSMLNENNINVISDNVYCCDYLNHGENCKAVIIKKLGIDVLIDDHMGYLMSADIPIRLFIMPNPSLPYYADNWNCDSEQFGRIKGSP